jgi:hypothetical protein
MARKSLTLLGGALFTALTAGATPFTVETGSVVTIEFNGFNDGSFVPGLTSTVVLSNFSFLFGGVNTAVHFNYEVDNTATSPVLAGRVTAFAFNTTPDIDTAASNTVSGVFTNIIFGSLHPNGIGLVEVCLSGAACPPGTSPGGVLLGGTGTGSASLYFAGNLSSLRFNNTFLRYEGLECVNNGCGPTASGKPSIVTLGQVPEPGTYALLSLGLAGIGLVSRKRRAA